MRACVQAEDKTAEALEKDGWLHTGDIGKWNEDGSLSIIDRKKNMFKLAQGEYVAAEELENIFARSRFVGQIWIYGNSFRTMLVAIVVPDFEIMVPHCANMGKPGSPKELAEMPEVKQIIMDDLKAVGKQAKLAGFK